MKIKKRLEKIYLALLLSTLILCSCGIFNSINLSGNWSGDYQMPSLRQSGHISFTLHQSGKDVTGTFSTSTNRHGRMEGRISKTKINGELTFLDRCGGTSTISGTIKNKGRRITGSGDTYDCLGRYSFSFSVSKS